MSDQLVTLLGAFAATLTSLSYIPQVKKAWPRGSTDGLSWKMLTALTAGLLLWIVYGFTNGDWVIVAANGVGAILSGIVLACKVRDIMGKNTANPATRSPAQDRIC
jgi:MtN3 and saliva related transmembrane protein